MFSDSSLLLPAFVSFIKARLEASQGKSISPSRVSSSHVPLLMPVNFSALHPFTLFSPSGIRLPTTSIQFKVIIIMKIYKQDLQNESNKIRRILAFSIIICTHKKRKQRVLWGDASKSVLYVRSPQPRGQQTVMSLWPVRNQALQQRVNSG